MTYENEVRSRKEIKDKINKDPSVLKNYAMVVEKHLWWFLIFIKEMPSYKEKKQKLRELVKKEEEERIEKIRK